MKQIKKKYDCIDIIFSNSVPTLSCSLPVKFFWLWMKVPAIKVQLALWNPNISWPNLSIISKQSSKHILFTQESICIYSFLIHDHELYQNQLSQLCFQCVALLLPTSHWIVKANTRYLQMLLVSPSRFTSKNAEWLEIKLITLIIDICHDIMKSGRTWVLPQASQHYSQQQPDYTVCTKLLICHILYVMIIYLCVCVVKYTAANRRQIIILVHDKWTPLVSVHC